MSAFFYRGVFNVRFPHHVAVYSLWCSPPLEGWIASNAKQDGVVRGMCVFLKLSGMFKDYKNHPGASRHPSTGGEHNPTTNHRVCMHIPMLFYLETTSQV